MRTVLLATEGTYPYDLGGVSTWCDELIRQVPDTRFVVFAVVMNPYVAVRHELPGSVERVVSIPLWGTQDPSEHRSDLPFSEVFLRRQRTSAERVEHGFLPLFERLMTQVVEEGSDPEAMGRSIVAMYRYFQTYDYQATFKAAAVWMAFRTRMLDVAARGTWPEPTLLELVQGLGWVYRFMTILNTPVPEADLVHSSAAAFCGLAGIVSKLERGTPYLLTEHGVYLREQYLSVGRSTMSPFAKRFLLALIKAIVRCNLHFADEIAPVCQFNARWERRLGAQPQKIRVVYNGVSAAEFTPGPPAAAAAADALEILSVARSDPNKDIETLLRAAAIVHQRLPQVRFRVLGAKTVPAYHDAMVMLRDRLGLAKVVEFGGHTARVAEAYRRADIVVQSSVTEGFPYSVIEAMMSGRAIVATAVGGTAEALADAGILVPARDPARLAAGVVVLCQDEVLRRRLGQSARERALRLFTIEHAMRQFDGVYARLAGRRPGAGVDLRDVELILAKAYALARLGRSRLALEQLAAALSSDPGGPLAPVVLAQMGRLERRAGRLDRQASLLARAWLVNHLRRPI